VQFHLKIEVPEDLSCLGTLRHLCVSMMTHAGCCKEDSNDVELVVSELCANVVRHARSEKKTYEVEFGYDSNAVLLKVIDHGVGFDRLNVLPPATERPDFDDGIRIGGLGLPLVEQICDSVEFEPTFPCGTTVVVRKAIRHH
jgi:serine/threonine-protein kinase RsbW